MLKWLFQGDSEPGRSSPSREGHQPGDRCGQNWEQSPAPLSALSFHYKLLTSSPLTSHLPQEKFSQGSYATIIIKGENG